MLPKDSSTWTDSDYRTSDYSPTAPESDITGRLTSVKCLNSINICILLACVKSHILL
jgi:hypothetical protein